MRPACRSPSAYRGKVLTKDGYAPDLKPPSRFRLPFNVINPSKLVLTEVSDRGMKEELKVFMPIDKLNLTYEVRGTFSISDNQGRIDGIFDRLSPQSRGDNSVLLVPMEAFNNPTLLMGLTRDSLKTDTEKKE